MIIKIFENEDTYIFLIGMRQSLEETWTLMLKSYESVDPLMTQEQPFQVSQVNQTSGTWLKVCNNGDLNEKCPQQVHVSHLGPSGGAIIESIMETLEGWTLLKEVCMGGLRDFTALLLFLFSFSASCVKCYVISQHPVSVTKPWTLTDSIPLEL